MQSANKNTDEILNPLKPNRDHRTQFDKLDVANEINDTFLSPLEEFTTLSSDYYHDSL